MTAGEEWTTMRMLLELAAVTAVLQIAAAAIVLLGAAIARWRRPAGGARTRLDDPDLARFGKRRSWEERNAASAVTGAQRVRGPRQRRPADVRRRGRPAQDASPRPADRNARRLTRRTS